MWWSEGFGYSQLSLARLCTNVQRWVERKAVKHKPVGGDQTSDRSVDRSFDLPRSQPTRLCKKETEVSKKNSVAGHMTLFEMNFQKGFTAYIVRKKFTTLDVQNPTISGGIA